MKIRVATIPYQARKLKARWTVDLPQDLAAYNTLDEFPISRVRLADGLDPKPGDLILMSLLEKMTTAVYVGKQEIADNRILRTFYVENQIIEAFESLDRWQPAMGLPTKSSYPADDIVVLKIISSVD